MVPAAGSWTCCASGLGIARFLYDPARRVVSVGPHLDEHMGCTSPDRWSNLSVGEPDRLGISTRRVEHE